MKESDDATVLQGMKNTLMTLELKLTELLTKYQQSYPLVVEADKEITDTKASIAAEEAKPLKEQTTDRNPTFAWVDAELAKAKADYSGLKAQEAAMVAIVAKYQTQARDLAQKGLIEQDLVRNYKADEENYLLYQKKREEARMTDALDSTRIVNVAVAETPVAPTLPAHSALFFSSSARSWLGCYRSEQYSLRNISIHRSVPRRKWRTNSTSRCWPPYPPTRMLSWPTAPMVTGVAGVRT